MAAGGSSASTPFIVDSLFQRSLDDMIKSLRSAPSGETPLLHRLLAGIRREIRSTDPHTKSLALQKLTFLSSHYSIDISWASFHALELLPSPILSFKRAAYLSASLSFHSSCTDLLPLATHQLRKDLRSGNPIVSSLALHLLALSSSEDFAVHLCDDLLSVLRSERCDVRVRRRAVGACLAVVRLNAGSSGGFLPKLVEALSSSSSDSSDSILSVAVGVFCELVCCGDPRPYLALAPDFHRVLVECRNNWILIKVVKIFARFVVLEPRLKRKVVDPICELMRRSPAKSLVFECVRIVFLCFGGEEMAMRLAVEKVKEFVASDDDANLRFLGLKALGLVGQGQSWAVEENREFIVKYLGDSDLNIRRESLRLVMNMVFENNVVEVSALLMSYALRSDPEFSNEILDAVLVTCGRNFYELVMDFDWYVALLGEMVRNPHFMKGEEVEGQLVDIGLRVKEARFELFRVARVLLIDPALLGNHFLCKVLSAAAWILGEYVEFSRNPLEIVEALLQPRTDLLPSLVRAVYIQAVFKIVTFCFNSLVNFGKCNADENNGAESEDSSDVATFKLDSLEIKEFLTSQSIIYMLNLIETALAPLTECDEVEVQERACNVLGLVHVLNGIEEWKTDDGDWKNDSKIRDIVRVLNAAFSEELGPISIHAQKRVLLPEGLELKENLSDIDVILKNNDVHPSLSISFSSRMHSHKDDKEESEPATESTSLLAEHRRRHGLYYLSTEKDENESNEYPKANDLTNSVSSDNATNDLLKLTDQSLIPRLQKPLKPRPKVVKLDEGFDDLPSSSSGLVKEPQEDVLSGAVRDVLSASTETSSTIGKTLSENYTQKEVKEASTISNVDSPLKESEVMQEREIGSSSSRKDKHHSRGKDKNRNSKKNVAKEEKGHRNSQRSSHHNGRQKKLHQRVESGDASLEVVPQAQVIQDFLL